MNISEKENERLNAMKRYLNFEFERDRNLQDIALLASGIMATPVSLITLMDKDVQWIITHHGIDITQMPRETSFCTHAIKDDELMVVNDALLDDRFKEAPLVKFAPGVRFYAGVPLKSDDGYNIGTLCVFDDKPRMPDEAQLDCLRALTRQVANIMDLNLSLKVINENYTEIETQHKALRKIAYLHSHELRAPLCNALGLMDVIKTEGPGENNYNFRLLESTLGELDKRIHIIVGETETAK